MEAPTLLIIAFCLLRDRDLTEGCLQPFDRHLLPIPPPACLTDPMGGVGL